MWFNSQTIDSFELVLIMNDSMNLSKQISNELHINSNSVNKQPLSCIVWAMLLILNLYIFVHKLFPV